MVKHVFQLRPWAAFAELNLATVVALLVVATLYVDTPVPMGNVAAVFVWVGWMTLFFMHFHHFVNSWRWPSPVILIGLYVVAMCIHIYLVPMAFKLDATDQSMAYRVVAGLGWIFGLLGPLFVIGSCARLLTRLEKEQDILGDKGIVTFLAFFFLPVGILAIQKRIRRLNAVLEN